MSLPFYISKMKATRQGDIKGSVTQKGRDGWIICQQFDHEIVSPRDVQTGLATGKRQHKPLRIVKYFDKSTPLLYNVLCSNESLPEVEIKFFSIPKAGKSAGAEVNYFTIQLTNANISNIRAYVPNALAPQNGPYSDMEEISFTYQKIVWTFTDGGITAEDDWEAPIQ